MSLKRMTPMPKSKQKARFPRLYLTLLGIVALLIVILSVASFLHERETLEMTSGENIRAEALRLSGEIERQIAESAAHCLRDEQLAAPAARLDGSIGATVAFRSRLPELSAKHPIAGDFFIVAGGELYFPKIEAGAPFRPVGAVHGGSPPEDQRFAELYRKAERESSLRRYGPAVEILEECSGMPVSDDLKSHALDLLARVHLAAKNPTNAVRIWNRLEDQFPDCLNEYHVPYALAAAIEIDELDAGANTDRKNTLRDLYKDLLDGRWPLSEEVVLKLKERLEKRLGSVPPGTGDSPYLDRFRLARIVRDALGNDAAEGEGIRSRVVQDGEDSVQIYYTALQSGGRKRTLAMSARPDWVRGGLLKQCRDRLNSHMKAVSKFEILPAGAAGNPDLRIPLKGHFTFLELRLPEGAVASEQLGYKLQLATIGLTTLTTLVLLGIIMALLLRITREKLTLKVKSDFLSHVSHELKTPLTLIQLYTETLLTDKDLEEEDRRYSLQVISRESSHLLDLIENLLHLSGSENAAEQYKLVEDDLGPVIEKTAGVYTEWLEKLGIALKIQIAPALPRVRFDRDKVTRAFLNLLDNARKYGGDAEPIEVGLWAENSHVILEVRDHGQGIPESERRMIFDQFFRGANAAESRGVGLGLFLVNETMKAHNGTVKLETAPGKGSAFRLVFPSSVKDAGPGGSIGAGNTLK